jgi:hypothetical protein
MQKLIAVEDARALMNVAKDWGVWRWLMEKKRVRATADRATEALDEAEKKVKAVWSDDLQKAYHELEALAAVDGDAKSKREYEKAKLAAKDVDPEIKTAIERVKDADDIAYDARWDAEDIFDEAEKQLSASRARQGAEKALESWDLREAAIRKAEVLGRRRQASRTA